MQDFGPTHLHKYFQRERNDHPHNTRRCAGKHSRTLKSLRICYFLEITRRSAFGLIDVYNLLPEWVVKADDVETF